jgi:hypothetical protein
MSASPLTMTMSVHRPARTTRLERPLPASLRHSIRMLDILCALIVPAACDTINSYGAQTFREPTT